MAHHRSPAEIERDIASDRQRINSELDALQSRLSPGQLLDDALALTKSNGTEIASNLGNQVKNSPLPLALVGLGLTWLLAKPEWGPSVQPPAPKATREREKHLPVPVQAGPTTFPVATVKAPVIHVETTSDSLGNQYHHFKDATGRKFRALTDESGKRAGHFVSSTGEVFRGFADASGKTVTEVADKSGKAFDDALGWASHSWDEASHATGNAARKAVTYPTTQIKGGVRRVRETTDDLGNRYHEFTDESGRKFRALSDEAGRRMGHFISDTGETFRGFVDESGKQIDALKDEAGNFIDNALGWASHTFKSGQHAAQDGWNAASEASQQLGANAAKAREAGVAQAQKLGSDAQKQFQQQPLAIGALAFAVGAALGAILPRNRREDEWFGKASDAVKREAAHQAGDAYHHGKEQASEAYDRVSTAVSDLHDQARDAAERERTRLN